MAKVKMKLELTGFKLEIEGEREDIPMIAENLNQQFAGFMEPAANIADGSTPVKNVPNQAASTESKPATKKKASRKKSNSSSKPKASNVELPSFRHDVEKYGNPEQEWGGIDKAIWMLYVCKEQLDMKEMSSIEIAAMFDRHFREAKAPDASHLSTYLSRAKSRKPAPVAADNNHDSTKWYLTQQGIADAQQLISDVTQSV